MPSWGVLKKITLSISPWYSLLWIYSRTAKPAEPSAIIINLLGGVKESLDVLFFYYFCIAFSKMEWLPLKSEVAASNGTSEGS